MIGKAKVQKMSRCAAACLLLAQAMLFGITVTVQDPGGSGVEGFRWLVERDTTNHTSPGVPVADSISLGIHNSYNPVVLKGHSDTSQANVNVPPGERYFISVLPDADYSVGGAAVDIGQALVTVVVHPQPIPTAQISIFVFADQNPINNVHDEHEQGVGGASIVIAEAGGQQMMDAFGNMLGTTYQRNPDGSFVLDPNDGTPLVEMMGTGIITTLTQADFDAGNNPYNLKVGEALVKNIAPGKYGVIVIPPPFDDDGNAIQWIQTSTIEGTRTIDAWVKANEPRLFVEGFGTGFNHCFFGFIKTAPTADSTYKGSTYAVPPWNAEQPTGTGTIAGRLRLNHFSRPPMTQGFFPGDIISDGWIGLNDPLVRPGQAVEAGGALQYAGIYAAPCNPDGTFVINNVPAGTYQLLTWDEPLDNLFGFHNVTVGEGEYVDLGDVLEYRWFGTYEGSVFLDDGGGDPAKAANGFRDPGERGIPEQNVNIRFRDGTIYQAQATDVFGEWSLEEVFPFFKWLVVEVDFARFKATGMTAVVDGGGEVLPHDGWDMPSFDKLNPQPQVDADGVPIINPNTMNNLSRTETGPVLTQAMHLFLNQANYMDWGKMPYGPGENGGISGIVFYDTTRAENDPRYCVGEPWQPGIPRVQVNLYVDSNQDGVIDDLIGNDGPTLADVDHYPFGWRDGGTPGTEDVDRNGNGDFDAGDAIQITTTDSWDDNKPTGSIGPVLTIHGEQVPVGMDAFATWNQIRPGVFDGGYAFDSFFPGGVDSGNPEMEGLPTGGYIVESTTPAGYEIVKEEDKNVDFGDEYIPSQLLLPPVCVGDLHTVPDELTLFPGVPCEFARQRRPLADCKQIIVTPGKNAAADFFFFTEVPKAARGVGFVNNDLGAEFNQSSINFGEKIAPSWIPIALRDWTGREFHRIYCDEFGGYNFLLHSTFSINVPAPSGVAPHMMTLVLNDPIKPDGTIDEFYNPVYSITPWTFQYYPGTTSYLDTPLVPLAAFAAAEVKIDTEPNNTPVIYSVDGPSAGFGPVVSQAAGGTITIRSVGTISVINPAYDPQTAGSPFRVDRNYGFGSVQGQVLLDGQPLAVTSWNDGEIQAVVPAGAATGRISVVRGDNGAATDVGVTLHMVDLAATPILYVAADGSADYESIQAAIDAASPGDLILVAPGTYNENVIMNKPVRLQGSGSGGVTIFGYPNPLEKLQEWHDRLNALGAAEFATFLTRNPLVENEAPGIIVIGETTFTGGTVQNPDVEETVVFNEGYPFNLPDKTLIDGFTVSGSKAGGGIFAVSGVSDLVISNINATGNQGTYAGGIAVGTQGIGFNSSNDNVVIRYCKIHKNGGIQGPGGICMNEYSNSYRIENNIIWGNFSRHNGGGIGHLGLCLGENVVYGNKIIFNEAYFGALMARAGDGGGIYIGDEVVGGNGTGHVTVNRNLIQGNISSAGYGGGIRAFAVNAEDVLENPDDPGSWYQLNLFNNIIVNNVAGLAGAGISLQDVANGSIVNNTVANNDCTATASLAFTAGQLDSTPQPSGIVGAEHSDLLAAMFGAGLQQTYSDPVLANNIIYHNRSWFNDASLNGNQGGLAPRPGSHYWDLAILNSTSPSDPHLTPTRCVMTSRFDPATGFDYGATANTYDDPEFISEYDNQLQSATVLDEGGNFINVLFTPLAIQGSDYHIDSASPAVGYGTLQYMNAFTELGEDFDGQSRVGFMVDSGADQISSNPSADEIIVDNLDANTSSVGTWSVSGAAGFWATNSVYSRTLGGSFTFNADVVPGVSYAVYEWHTTFVSRWTDVPHQIRSGNTLLDTVYINQQLNGSQWNLLGVYTFDDAAAISIIPTPASGGVNWSTCADAVRFVPVTLESLEITGPTAVGENTLADYEAIAHYTGGLSAAVNPQVWLVDAAQASIDTDGLLTAGAVTADTPAVISAQYSSNGIVANDTHSITILDGPVASEVIIDNLDANTSSVGTWEVSGAGGFWATNSVWSRTSGGSFTFNATLVPGASYAVYEWHTVLSSRYTAVPHQIRDGGTLLETVNVNQLVNGGQWNLLGVYTFTGAGSVTIIPTPASGTNNWSTNADAVRFVPVTLESLEITGPVTVGENTVTDYEAIAHYTGGLSATVNPQWSVDAAQASIDADGMLTAGAVTADTSAVISAQYTGNGTAVNDTHSITILDGPAPTEVIVDNLDANTSSVGTWPVSGAGGFWATNSVYSRTLGGSFTFNAALVPGVSYEVYEWHTTFVSRWTSVPHQIWDGGTLLETVNVNQQLNGSQWNLLGVYTFNDTAGVSIIPTPASGGVNWSTCADAIRFVPVP